MLKVDLEFSRNKRGPKRLRVRDDQGDTVATFTVQDGQFSACRTEAEAFAACGTADGQ